jgi:Uma2 family endonuclease
MSILREGLTLADFEALPEQKPALEYYRGKVTQKVSPQPEHGALHYSVVTLLTERLGSKRHGRIFIETRIVFGDASLVPDVSFYRRERIPRSGPGRIGGRGEQPPNLVVEILSPGQSLAEQIDRCAYFVAQGVDVALLLEPAAENVWVFRTDQPRAVHHGSEPIVIDEVVPGLFLVPSEIYASLDFDEELG